MPLSVVNHPEGKETVKLADYKDKLIIIDFWATWCKPCITSLHKLDTLQQQFADDLAVIPTTYEDADRAAPFVQARGWSLPTAVTETTLKEYFPHRSIPHQVWVKDGRVLAIAGPEYADDIAKVLQGRQVDFDHKTEVAFDKEKPLFLNGNGGDGSNMLYQSVISGRLNARVGGVSSSSPNEILAYNRTIEQLYKIAFEHKISPQISSRYIIYEVDEDLVNQINPSKVLSLKNKEEKQKWSEENLYCYNLVLPKNCDKDDLSRRMLNDLNDFFGNYLNFQVSYEPRVLKALAIVKTDSFKGISTKGGEKNIDWDAKKEKFILQNEPLSTLLYYMNIAFSYNVRLNLDDYPNPLVDETAIDGNVDLTIEANLRDFPSVSKELRKYGLDLVEKISIVEMIVFKYADKAVE